ncbi:MAG: hypothetical protein ACAI38_24970 [Myxococcota bacterium]|nr:hypothetical protein [Myxococcota bacterium]
MQLEQIVLGMRQRSGWEALDLGFALVRHAFRDIYAALFVVAVPLAALAVTLGQLTEPLYGWLLLWWAKPILDAVTLSVLARALIGERSKVSRVFTTVPRGIQRHLLGALTLRRLSPSRTFTMPVRHLEGLSSKDARRRIATLAMNHRGSAQLACVVLMVFEVALILCGLQAMAMFTTTPMSGETSMFPESVPSAVAVLNTFVAMLVLEPVFAAMGFALYVNRRVELEGWDLELAFRALRARVQRKSGGKVAAMVALALLMLLPTLASAQGEELVGPPPPPSKVIKEVLAHPDFDPWRPTERWMPVEKPKEADEEADLAEAPNIPFAAIGTIIAEAMPYVLGAVGLALVVHLTLIMLRNRVGRSVLEQLTPRGDDEQAPAKKLVIAGDVVGSARAAWQRGEQALALSILYRGSIGYFASHAQVDFPEGATEQECIALVRRKTSTSPATEAFTAIARSWQRCAYAHTLPSASEFDSLSHAYSATFIAVTVPEEPVA